MKRLTAYTFVLLTLLSCNEESNEVFEKTPEERVAEAISALKDDLTEPNEGWRVKYTPVAGGGSYNLLLQFNDDNTVRIQSDLSANDGEFFDQTITYRIDNSVGLELIFESHSMFSYLFELDQATFGAEYEFLYAEKQDDNLVFVSKTDFGQDKTQLTLEESDGNDLSLLGRATASNLGEFSDDLKLFSSSLRMRFPDRDLILYLSIDDIKRTISIHSASLQSDLTSAVTLDFETGFTLQAGRIILDEEFNASVFGETVAFTNILLDEVGESTIDLCGMPSAINTISGSVSSTDQIVLETTLVSAVGESFAESDFYLGPLVYLFHDGESQYDEVLADIPGAAEMHLYYDLQLQDGTTLNAFGFVVQNSNGSYSLVLKEFEPVLENNRLVFNFQDGFRYFGEEETDADLEGITKYLDLIAENDQTYIVKFTTGIFELYNPCSKYSLVLYDQN